MRDDSGSHAVFTEQGSSASQLTAANVMDIKIKTARMRRTSSRCSISLHPGQNNGRCTDVIENSKVRMSRYFGHVYRKHKMAQIMVQYGRSGRSFRAKFARSSFGRTAMAKAIRERSIKIRSGTSSKLGMLAYSLTEKKGHSCLCMWTI